MAYTTTAAIRLMDGMDDDTTYKDATISAAIDHVTALVDRYIGTSFEYKSYNVTLDGSNSRSIQLRDEEGRVVMYPRTISACTIDDVAQTTTDWALHYDGIVTRDTGTFTYSRPGLNVNVQGTAGLTSAIPDAPKWAVEQWVRHVALSLKSRIPDRALSIQNDFGTVRLSTPAPNRASGLPEVDAILEQYRQRIGTLL